MTVKFRAFVVMALWFIACLGLMLHAALYQNPGYIFAIIITVVAGLYLISLRCPNCGHPIFKQKKTFLGEQFEAWGGMPPDHCEKCGKEL